MQRSESLRSALFVHLSHSAWNSGALRTQPWLGEFAEVRWRCSIEAHPRKEQNLDREPDCQRFFKVGIWQHHFEVARQNITANAERQASRKQHFFEAQEDDIKAAERDAAEDADRVHGFDDYVSAVVPWLRETGIANHIRNLRKDEIRTAIAVPPLGDESDLRIVVDAMESLLRDAHKLCFDGPECMLT